MNARNLLTAVALSALVSLVGATPAMAEQISPPKYRDAWDDTVCGIDVHVVVDASNPIIETGHVNANGFSPTIDAGHVELRLTNVANGHWMEDNFSGPAKVLSWVLNADGTESKRVVFSGLKREFRAWDGTVVADRGRLVVDYLIQGDEILSRTEVSRAGDFPIASGTVDF